MRRHEKLILEHMSLVRTCAARLHRRHGGDLDEFEADGMVGLIEAAKRYKPSKNDRFDRYARNRIEGAILDGYRRLDVIGRHERELRKKDPERQEKLGHLIHSQRVDINDPEQWDALMEVAGDQIEALERRYWKELLAILPTRLKFVMKMYYFEDKTDQEIGLAMGGKTGSWVARLRIEAITTIRIYLLKKGLLDGH